MASGSTQANPFGNPGSSINHAPHGEGVFGAVALAPNMDKAAYQTGRVRPTLVTAEQSFSSNIVVDGKDAIYPQDTPFNFVIDMTTPLTRARIATVQKVIMPLINNCCRLNNTVRVGVYDANEAPYPILHVIEFVLQPAVYDPASLCNAIAGLLNEGLTTTPFVQATFTVDFEPVTQTFTILLTDADPGEDLRFQLDQNCTFVTRGRFFAGFSGVELSQSKLESGAPVISYKKLRSGRAGMVFTRFVTVHSREMTNYAYEKTRTSDNEQGRDIIAVVDVTGIYNDGNFDVTVPFSGVYRVLETPEAPKISLLNAAQKLDRFIDFSVRDEYGFLLDESMMNLVTPYYAQDEEDPDETFTCTNTLGVSIWMEIFF